MVFADEDFSVECVRCGRKEFSAVQMPKKWVCGDCWADFCAGVKVKAVK